MASKDYYSKEDRRIYMQVWAEKRKLRRLGISSLIPEPIVLPPMEPLPLNGNRRLCSTFGCGKVLTSTESLCGNKCIDCQNKKPIDPTLVIKFK